MPGLHGVNGKRTELFPPFIIHSEKVTEVVPFAPPDHTILCNMAPSSLTSSLHSTWGHTCDWEAGEPRTKFHERPGLYSGKDKTEEITNKKHFLTLWC